MEMTQLYQKKYENYQKAMNRQEPDHVPNVVSNAGGGMFYAGKTIFDVIGDQAAYARALTSFMDEMWVDVNTVSAITLTPRLSATFPTAENHLAADGTLSHLQTPFMKPEEYDQLIADPKTYIANVLLPRKYPDLFSDRDKAKEMLKVYAEEQVSNFVMQIGYTHKYIAETYGVPTINNNGCMINTPVDYLFDYFRGFRGTLTDLRRHPDKVRSALDVIWEYRCAAMVAGPYNASEGLAFQPCHIPAYLSPKQFKELYWPYEKRLIEWIASYGGKIYLMMQGRWENVMDCFLEVPKDSVVLVVDDDDFLKVHERLGHHQILCGGLKMADTRLKKFEDIKDDIKRVIDTCAPGGGFLFNSDKNLLTPGDVNPTLIECYNFAHEYSSK